MPAWLAGLGLGALIQLMTRVFSFLASLLSFGTAGGFISLYWFGARLIKGLLANLGFGVVAFIGFSVVFNQVTSFIISHFLKIPIEIQQLLGLAKVDIAFNIIMGAFMARFIVRGFGNADKINKFGFIGEK